MKIILEIIPYDLNPNISDLLVELAEHIIDEKGFEELYHKSISDSDNAEYRLIIE